MTGNALLTVSRPELLSMRVGGMSVLERQLWTLHRAGFERAWVGATAPAPGTRLPSRLEIRWCGSSQEARASCPAPFLVVPAERLMRVEALTRLRQGSPGGEEEGSAFLIDPDRPQEALAWLLAVGVKSHDGFMARNFDRHISLAISRRLLDTRVTPNMMTVMSSLIGLCGAAFFLAPTHASRLTGAMLVWLHSVLDGCDGELARVRFQESPLGADIDFWGDNVVHVALFACLSYGFFRADQSWIPLALGLAAAAGTIGSAILSFKERRRRRRNPAAPPRPDQTLSRIADILAARDFIYLLVTLALVDRLYEFLWASAVGSLLFFLMMLYSGRDRDEQVELPHPSGERQAGSAPAGHGRGHQHLYSRG